jgi:hypothetical protein
MIQPPWSDLEVKLIISDYFSMLIDELASRTVNKAHHRRNLISLLNNRSDGAIEFKHQNISAVLITLGQPYIKGYLPKYNYQKILEDHIVDYLKNDHQMENYFKNFSEKEVIPNIIDFRKEKFVVAPPVIQYVEEPNIKFNNGPFKINYLEREQNNQKLGKCGEELVLSFEKWNLHALGYSKLADRVEWISQSTGDGSGFDILSRNPDGSDKYIEVKTTKLSKESPFFFTANELQFSIDHKERYHLYRLFNFEQSPRMFKKQGDFKTICRSTPIVFKGYF